MEFLLYQQSQIFSRMYKKAFKGNQGWANGIVPSCSSQISSGTTENLQALNAKLQTAEDKCTFYCIYLAIRRGFTLFRMTTNTKPVLWNYARIRVLPFLNNPKDPDPSYKMDLDFKIVLEGKKLCLITEEIRYLVLMKVQEELLLSPRCWCLCPLADGFG